MYSAKVIAHSIARNVPLLTFELVFPRFILAEFNTHRVLSRNSASSRAIPVARRIESVRANPFVPAAFAANQKGMQAGEALTPREQLAAQTIWLQGRDAMIVMAEALANLGAHKQWANRPLELFAWHVVVVTGTEWDNLYALRDHKDASPEFQTAMRLMREAHEASKPIELRPGQWHLPYVDEASERLEDTVGVVTNPDGTEEQMHGLTRHDDIVLVKKSTARCARVSGERQTLRLSTEEDVQRADSLSSAGHMSPLEHPARVATDIEMQFASKESEFDGEYFRFTGRSFFGNFQAPWIQYRKLIPGERVFRSQVAK